MNLKALREKRNTLMDEMDALLAACEENGEVRAMSEDNVARFAEIETEVRGTDETIAACEARDRMAQQSGAGAGQQEGGEQRALDEQNFLAFIRGEQRALTVADNGAVIPEHIAARIIEEVKELSPIYAMATVFNLGGDLVFPVYDEETSSISAAFMDDMDELVEGTGKFTSVKLENFIVGSVAKVSRSLLNRTDFDLLGFVVYRVARAIAEFLEKHLIQGAEDKNVGILGATQGVTAASATALTADDLIDVQMSVPQVYQSNAVWLMHKSTLRALRKLKTGDGEYLLNRDLTAGFGWSLLGKSVYITESMPEIATGKAVVAYGDMSGLYVKLAQDVELQVLVEKYATQHALGVCGYVEFDSDIIEPQKISLLKMA